MIAAVIQLSLTAVCQPAQLGVIGSFAHIVVKKELALSLEKLSFTADSNKLKVQIWSPFSFLKFPILSIW